MSLSGIIEETHSHLCDLPGFLLWDYPGSPVIKIPHFHFRRHGGDPIPGQGTKIPHATENSQKKEKKKKTC